MVEKWVRCKFSFRDDTWGKSNHGQEMRCLTLHREFGCVSGWFVTLLKLLIIKNKIKLEVGTWAETQKTWWKTYLGFVRVSSFIGFVNMCC